jgi:hypothetical protein
MITLIQCVKSRTELSIQEFREHWKVYGKKARVLAEASGAVGLHTHTTLAVDQNLDLRLNRGTSEAYDGVLEFSWPNAAGLKEMLEHPAAAPLLEDFRSYQERFIDLDRSSFFFAAEEALLGGGP